jgi:hypothetical protein
MTEASDLNEGGSLPAAPSVPTGADLNWRTVWPGQWTCDNAGYIWADSIKGGRTHMIDVRGWGYLTGRGHGALDLDNVTASRIQDGLGALLCAAPDLLEACQLAVVPLGSTGPTPAYEAVLAAIAKATTANSVGTDERSEGVNP